MPPSATAQAQIDRANKVLREGSTVTPGCATCQSNDRPCTIYPPGKGKLNKCYQCTLNKQSCSIDRKMNPNEYNKQSFNESSTPPVSDQEMDMPARSLLDARSPSIAFDRTENLERSNLTPFQALMKLDQAIVQISSVLQNLKDVREALAQGSTDSVASDRSASDRSTSDRSMVWDLSD